MREEKSVIHEATYTEKIEARDQEVENLRDKIKKRANEAESTYSGLITILAIASFFGFSQGCDPGNSSPYRNSQVGTYLESKKALTHLEEVQLNLRSGAVLESESYKSRLEEAAKSIDESVAKTKKEVEKLENSQEILEHKVWKEKQSLWGYLYGGIMLLGSLGLVALGAGSKNRWERKYKKEREKIDRRYFEIE